MSSGYCAAAGRTTVNGEPHRERYSFGNRTNSTLAQRWRSAVVVASWIILGSLTTVVAPTAANAQTSDLTIVVSPPSGSLATGESVEYTYTLTNGGAQEATSIAVSDSLGIDAKCESDVLAAGASTTCTGTYTITDADVEAGELVNTAEVTASSAACASKDLTAAPNGTAAPYTFSSGETGWQWIVDYTDAAGATVATIHTRVKSDDNSTALASGLVGSNFTFQYGDLSTDEGYKPIEIEIAVSNNAKVDAGTLVLNARGATNLASFTGDNNASGFAVSTSGKATGPVLITESEASDVTLDPAGADTAPDVGATLSPDTRYSLGDTQIFVDEAPGFALQYGYPDMAGGDTATFGFDKYGAALDFENNEWIASVRGCADAGDKLTASDTETTTLAQVLPSADAAALTLVVNQPTGSFAKDATLTWKIDVTNTGTVAIKDLKLADAFADGANESCPKATLDPKETITCTATYKVTQADVDKGQIANFATATGVLPDGTAVTGKGEATTTLAPRPSAALTVKKLGVVVDANGDRQFQVGETIKYSIVATNVGNVDLTDITIDDPLTNDEACPSKTLAVGKVMTCTATHAITASEIAAGSVSNTATVTGTDPTGKKVNGQGSAVNALTSASSIAVDKGHPTGSPAVGGTLKYPITVTNTGMTQLVNLQVSDSLVGAVSCDYQALNPGAVARCTAAYVVTAQDANAGKVVNTVTVVAKDTQGVEVAAADFVTTVISGPAATPTPVPTLAVTPTPTLTAMASPVPVTPTPTPTPRPGLAVTGSNAGPPTMAALVMILVGLVLVAATRRRRPMS